jgi:hypothetical protein
MYLRGQMNLSVFLGVKLIEIAEKFTVKTFDTIQFLGLSNGNDEVGFKDFRNVSLLVKESSDYKETENKGNSKRLFINLILEEKSPKTLYPCTEENLLSESQKLIELDSFNALLNEGTNYYNKQAFIPLTKKKNSSKTRERNPTKPAKKLKLKNKKNGRLFQLKDNILFVELLGETAVGNKTNHENESELFSKSKAICMD